MANRYERTEFPMSRYLEGSPRSVSCKLVMDITKQVLEEPGIEAGSPHAGEQIVLHLLEGVGRDPGRPMGIEEGVGIAGHPSIVRPAGKPGDDLLQGILSGRFGYLDLEGEG